MCDCLLACLLVCLFAFCLRVVCSTQQFFVVSQPVQASFAYCSCVLCVCGCQHRCECASYELRVVCVMLLWGFVFASVGSLCGVVLESLWTHIVPLPLLPLPSLVLRVVVAAIHTAMAPQPPKVLCRREGRGCLCMLTAHPGAVCCCERCVQHVYRTWQHVQPA